MKSEREKNDYLLQNIKKKNPTHILQILFCLVLSVVSEVCSGLMLERLPRHIPRGQERMDSAEDDDFGDVFDNSVEKKRIVGDPSEWWTVC